MAGIAGAATVCLAADASPVSETFGNTIRSTYPDGRTAELWLAPDGNYTAEGRRHDPSSGHWKVKGEKLCLKQSRPFPWFGYCFAVPKTSMADGWSGKAVTGEPIRIQLVQGHVVGG